MRDASGYWNRYCVAGRSRLPFNPMAQIVTPTVSQRMGRGEWSAEMIGSMASEIAGEGPDPWPRVSGMRPLRSAWRSLTRSAAAAVLLAGLLSTAQVVPTDALSSSAAVTMTAHFSMCSPGDGPCGSQPEANAQQAVVLATPPVALIPPATGSGGTQARQVAPPPVETPTPNYPSAPLSRIAASRWR